MTLRTIGLLGFVATSLAGCAAHSNDELGEGVADDLAEYRPDRANTSGLSMRVLGFPRYVTTTDERRHLVYETLLENTGSVDVHLERFDVFGANERTPLASYTPENAENVIFAVNTASLDPFVPGAVAVVFVDASAPLHGVAPSRLRQRLTASTTDGAPRRATLDISVVRAPPIELDLPLARQGLLDLNGCCNGAHTRAVLPFPEGLFVAQRFAIDFVQLSETGLTTFEGDPKTNESYFLYGAEVRAAARGRIVAVRDGMIENTPTEPLPAFDTDSAAGNFVIERFDEDHFALYAHLEPGTIRVNVGDRVDAGSVLGRVGNSGNSTEPHLHFQVMDRPSPLAADGLPYVFKRFRLTAKLELTPEGVSVNALPAPTWRRARLPLFGDVLSP